MNQGKYLATILVSLMLALFGMAWQTGEAQASPANPGEIIINQPDGSFYPAHAWGDEYQHGMETVEGYTIIKDTQSGYWVFAVVQNGILVAAPGNLVVGKASPAGLTLHARPAITPATAQRRARQRSLQAQNQGTQKMVLVLVSFNNYGFNSPATASGFQSLAFGSSNSISDYYAKASYNKLILEPAETQNTTYAGIIPVTLARNYPANASDLSQTIADEAYAGMDPYINFADFDTNHDGYVTSSELHVIFIIAGYEQANCSSVCPRNVPITWAHQWDLPWPMQMDGVSLGVPYNNQYGGYSMVGAVNGIGNSSDQIARLGILVHELGHDLSWPDLYDTTFATEGVGDWSVMGSGVWNKGWPGISPALPDAFLKYYQGWLTPTTTSPGNSYLLHNSSENAEALLLGNNPNGLDWDFTFHAGTGEYWLVENRRRTSYDIVLPADGILIWHINEAASYDDKVNNPYNASSHPYYPLVMLEQADGFSELNASTGGNRGEGGDPYPGTYLKSGSKNPNYVFNTRSVPNSKFYSGSSSDTGLSINNTLSGNLVSVTVSTGSPTLQPDLQVSLANDTPRSFMVLGGSFNWKLTVKNPGMGDATYFENQTVLKNVLPPTGASYGTITIDNSTNITHPANLNCQVVGNPAQLMCQTRSGSDYFTIGAQTGSFTVTIPVTPNATGQLLNSGATVDPPYLTNLNGVIIESNESNNTSNSDSVTVVAAALNLETFLPAMPFSRFATGFIQIDHGALPNQLLQLFTSRDGGITAQKAAETRSSSSGSYSLPALDAEPTRLFFVRFINDLSDYHQLSYHICNNVTNRASEYVCDINARDVRLIFPRSGTATGLPVQFEWMTRATTTDSYAIEFYDTNWNLLAVTSGFGYTSQGIVNCAWPGATTGTQYYWAMRVYTPNGFGSSYFARSITFKNLGFCTGSPGLSGSGQPGRQWDPAAPLPPGEKMPAKSE